MDDTKYNPASIEQPWAQAWEKNGYFKPSNTGEPYCIMIPPPNVTGSLHMGHAFQHTLMDVLIRYQRMQGKNVLWQPGTDHAGISTQMVVERQLAALGKTRHDLGREKFEETVWQWKEESGGMISEQMRRLGSSVDWDRDRFTMDDGMSLAVQKVFIDLYQEGLIYKGQKLVNWDPVLESAISDLEAVSQEKQGHLWHINYLLEDGSGQLTVATTRPETLLGDTAVAVHPDDARYKHLIGKQLKLPLTDRTIPIIADTYVDPAFGSGCVKITPAHDFNDYEVGKRHALPMINIFTTTAHINDNAPEVYRGLERFVARKRIVADLEALGLIKKIDSHTMQVPYGDRSGAVIEPYLTSQWFVKMEPLAKPAIAAVKQGDIKFIPENWDKTYFHWLNNIQDWCISRQLWWGHRIPAWSDASGEIYVGESETAVREFYKLNAEVTLTQDPDVLETWFSSALWPFSTLGWPEKTPDFKTFYPTQVLITGFDIIFFWVARMIMMGIKFTGQIPFHEVFITGLVRDAQGQKMSKSKGNGIDPLDLIDGISLDDLVKKRTANMMQPELAKKIEKNTRKEYPQGIEPHGTDALRFTICALASTGRDINFDISRMEGYRNFCNKLWNAKRFIFMNLGPTNQDKTQELSHPERVPCPNQESLALHEKERSFDFALTRFAQDDTTEKLPYSTADLWIRSELQKTIREFRAHLDSYRFDLASQVAYEFVWNEFCDWYLELSKTILNDPQSSPAQIAGTRHTLVHTLETILRLLHPMMPFITEELWQKVSKVAGLSAESIMLQHFPQANDALIDKKATQDITWVKQFVLAVRNIRGEMTISPKIEIPVLLSQNGMRDKKMLESLMHFITPLTKINSITWLQAGDEKPPAATGLVGDLEILIPLKGLIDKDAETQRLSKLIEKAQKELLFTENRLNNEGYVAKAPAQVVASEREKLASLKQALLTYQAQLLGLGEL